MRAGNLAKALLAALTLMIWLGQMAAHAQNPDAGDVTTGLAGHWRLDETSGTNVIDSSGNGNDGTLSGTDFDTSAVDGRVSGGLHFDGVDSVITIPHSASLAVNDIVSVSFWMKSPEIQANNFGRIISKGRGDVDTGFIISQRGNEPDLHSVVGTSAGTNQFFGLGLVQPFDDKWHHIVVVLNNGSRVIHMDGVEVVNNTYNHGTGFASPDDVLIGALNLGGGQALTGILDDVRIYNRALTADDVALLYRSYPGQVACTAAHEAVMWFNHDEGVMQYCNGTDWISIGGDPDCSNIGDFCNDGTVYAGLSPDGDVPMFISLVDLPNAWESFNNGNNTGFVDTAMINCSAKGGPEASCRTGETNTAVMLSEDADLSVVGVQPHRAALYCHCLGKPVVDECAGDPTAGAESHGRDDWYMPAIDELDVILENLIDQDGDNINGGLFPTAPFNLNIGTFYRSSSEFNSGTQLRIRMSDWGYSDSSSKSATASHSTRCIRKQETMNSLGPGCTSPTGKAGEMNYNLAEAVMQYCDGNNWISMGPKSAAAGSGGIKAPRIVDAGFGSNNVQEVRIVGAGILLRRSGEIRRSTDGGENWSIIPTAPINESEFDYDGSVLVVGSGNSIAISTDFGVTWTDRSAELNVSNPWNVKPRLINGLLFAIDGNGVIKSSNDLGATWTDHTAAYNAGPAWINDILSAGGSTIYGFGANGQIKRSTDNGISWSNVLGAGGRWFSDDLVFNDVIIKGGYIGTTSDESYITVSEDNGNTWLERTLDGIATGNIQISYNGTHLAVADMFSQNLFISTDLGQTWTDISAQFQAAPGFPIRDVAFDGTDLWVVGSNGGVAVFEDGFEDMGLIGHWKLDETTGTVAVNAANPGTNDGTVTGTDFDTDSVAGVSGGAMNFDGDWNGGNPDRIEIVTNDENNPMTNRGALTLAAWVWPASDMIEGGIVARHGATTDSIYQLGVRSDNRRIRYEHYDGASFTSSNIAGVLNLDAWNHVAVVRESNGTSIEIFHNGALVHQTSLSGPPASTTPALFMIGANTSSVDSNMKGPIDDVRIYNRALSAAEVATLYATTGGGAAPITGCPNIGDTCDDGTIYAGMSPDGDVPMYITDSDQGSVSWNDGNTNYFTTGVTSGITGYQNTMDLIDIDSDSLAAGVQPHNAAQVCADLAAHSHVDWYLPARSELGRIYNNLVDQDGDNAPGGPLGDPSTLFGFDVSGTRYNSSTEFDNNESFFVRFDTGGDCRHNGGCVGVFKDDTGLVRCARKGDTVPGGRCSTPPGAAGEMIYNDDFNVMQWCNGREWVQAQ